MQWNSAALVDWHRSEVDALKEKLGILSLSRTGRSLAMWAHYAGAGTGLVIEYSDLGSHFSGDDTGILGQLHKVKYCNDRTLHTFDPESHLGLFTTKFQDWSYEEEVRIIQALDDCDRASSELGVSGPAQFVRIDAAKHISRILVGWAVRADVEECIFDAARKHGLEDRVKSLKSWTELLDESQ